MAAVKQRSYPYVLFGKTYPCDGFNAIDDVHDQAYLEYMDHPLTMAMSFLGIPNRPLSADKKQSATNILKNIGYAPWGLLFFIPKLAINIVKLVTEFLPFLAAHALRDISHDPKRSEIVRGLAIAGSLFFDAIGIIGRCLTSPVKSMRVGLKLGERLYGAYSTKAKVVGGLLAALSLAVTVAAYVFLFPFVAHLIAPYVATLANTYLPPVVMNAFLAVSPHLTMLGTAIETMLGVTLTPVATGIAVIIGLAAATIGTVANRVFDKAINWFFHGHESIQKAVNAKLESEIKQGYENADKSIREHKEIVVKEDYLNSTDLKQTMKIFKPAAPENNVAPEAEEASRLTPRPGSRD